MSSHTSTTKEDEKMKERIEKEKSEKEKSRKEKELNKQTFRETHIKENFKRIYILLNSFS